ncbi:MAG TPA: LAGLIDADG family homing endonuclease [Opitutaceae bacterium]|nr:LAGLIDADG family homing endonuclease [Opitutaceae bacterium]
MLSPDHIDWLQHERGIDPEVATAMGLYSVARGVDGAAHENMTGRILAFPFFRHGEEVNTKYRDPHDKSRMWQRKGGQHILFNRDCLLDPALEEGRLPLVITEGEIDCLTAAQVGFPLSTSVPDGAPPARDRNGALIAVPEGTADIDPETDHKFGFVLEAWPLLSKVKRIILAVDDDEPGHRLRDELARRLGRARCEFVTYPAEPVVPDEHGELRRCKDLNEVLVYLGQKAVQDILFGAKPMPVAGLYGEADFPPEQPIEAVSTGWPRLDDHLRLYTPCLMVVTGFANHGKALAVDTPIPTPSGWTTMGDLQVGDEVFDEAGRVCRVRRATDVMVDRPCYLVSFSDGGRIVADADHLWLTSTEQSRNSERNSRSRAGRAAVKPRGTDQSHKRTFSAVRTTAEIAATLLTQGGRPNHRVPLSGALELPPQPLPLDPYLLGVWLGDGTSENGSITCFEPEIIESLSALGETITAWHAPGRYNVTCLKTRLRAMGLLGDKRIPPEYLRASADQRLALLQGLMDTDGHASRDRRCEFVSMSRTLAEGVRELALSLGIKAVLTSGLASLGGRVTGEKFRVMFATATPVFRVKRKLERQRAGVPVKSASRAIVAAEPCKSVPVRCIEVDSPSHLFLAGRAMIPTHNSTWTTQLAANVALLHRWPVTIASFEMRKSMIDRTIRNALIAKVGGGQAEAFQRARQIQRDYFSWIAPQPDCEDALDIDWLLERATAAVLRHGTKVLLVDPWNEIEHSRDRSETMTEYTSRALRKLKRWAHQMDALVIVVAHPSKGAIHKEAHEVTLYDVADSAHWANKPDLGVVIARLGENPEVDTLTAVAVRKVRYQPDAGKLGTVEITFDPKERIFSE